MDSSEGEVVSEITNGVNEIIAVEEDLSSASESTCKQVPDVLSSEVAVVDCETDVQIVSESENEVSMMSVESEPNQTVDLEDSAVASEEPTVLAEETDDNSALRDVTEKKLCNIEETELESPNAMKDEKDGIVIDDDVTQTDTVQNGTTKSSAASNSDKTEDILKDSSSNVISGDTNNEESTAKQESKSSSKKEKKKGKNCAECGKKGKKFRLHYQGQNHNLCSEDCYKNFKIKLGSNKAQPPAKSQEPDLTGGKCLLCSQDITTGYYPTAGQMKPLCSEDCVKKYQMDNASPTECGQCKQHVTDINKQLLWEMMIFCSEVCLDKYQSVLGSHCTCCQQPVQQPSLGKYCVCFGADIRQFCSGTCLEEFKKGLKVCTFCQTDLSSASDGFLAPVGEKGQFKDFCSPTCMERFETSNSISKTPNETQDCANCKKMGTFTTRVTYNNTYHFLCSDSCVSGFRCSHKINMNMCDTCYNFFTPDSDKGFSFKMENTYRYFCSKPCSTLYVLSHRKITQCVQCKVKKYNTDMIEKVDAVSGTANTFCSLNCLSLFRVTSSATSGKTIRCDFCGKASPAQYHLTMSDGSIRNFCNYGCVMSFQNQFSTVPALTSSANSRQPVPGTLKPGTKATPTQSPVIANVVSLAGSGSKSLVSPSNLIRPQSVPVLSPRPQQSMASGNSSPTTPRGSHVPREVIVRPPAPKALKNKTVSCKPIMQTKGVSAKLQTCHKAVQTDDSPTPIFLPIPVPVYVPTPMHMFSRPVPCPVPFPVPIPIPLLMPTKTEVTTANVAPSLHSQDSRPISTSHPYDIDLLKMPDLTDSTLPKDHSVESGIRSLNDNVSQGNNHEKLPTIPKIKEEIISDLSGNEKEQELSSDEDFMMKGECRKRIASPDHLDDMDYKRLRQDDIPPIDIDPQSQALYVDPFNEEPEKNLKVH